MKTYFLLFWIACICFTTSGYGINIPQRFGCDTLLWKGNQAQLKQLEKVISDELQKARQQKDMATVANLYTLMGETNVAMGHYEKAVEWYQKGIFIFKKTDFSIPENEALHYDYALCLKGMTNVLTSLGESTDTILEYLQQSVLEQNAWLPYAKAHISSNQRVFAQLQYVLILLQTTSGNLCMHCREFSNSIQEYEKAITMIEDGFTKRAHETIEYANVLASIGDIYERVNNYEQALQYFQSSLHTIQVVIGTENIPYAQILNRIGNIYYSLNNLESALTYIAQSLDIYKKKNFIEHAGYAQAIVGLGMINLNLYQNNESLECFQTACQIYQSTCGKESFLTLLAELYTAYPHLMKGEVDRAWEITEIINNERFNKNVASDHFLNGAILATDIGLLRKEYDEIIDIQNSIYELLEVYQGNVSNRSLRNFYLNTGRAYRRKGDYKNAAKLFEKVLQLQREMAHDNFTFLPEEQRLQLWALDETRMNSLLCMNNEKEETQNQVGGLLYDAALLNKGLLLEASINLARVVQNSQDEVLKKKFLQLQLLRQQVMATEGTETEEVKNLESELLQEAKKYGDFMEFTALTWQDIQKQLGPNDVAIEFICSTYENSYTYSAEVLRRNMQQPKHIFLFTLPAEQTEQLRSRPGEFSPFICKYIWKKEILRLLRPGDNVYFVPSGELYNIGIEYIPTDNGQRMCDLYQMNRLSSTRELAAKGKNRIQRSSALYGGLNYNTSLSDMELYAFESGVRGNRVDTDNDFQPALWQYLPGTRQEVEQIARSLQQKDYSISLYTGEQGVEESFKALSGTHTGIIHIATHGFYQPGSENALQRSGLIFAGANNFRTKKNTHIDIDDGTLTAREISLLNLQGTDLVVMSACQTGLGEITGEGVFGLQRAFKKAGAQTLLMSLWEVDDKATQCMMSAFYDALTAGKSKRQALLSAQNALKQQTFTKEGKSCPGTDPFFWAAFIMMD